MTVSIKNKPDYMMVLTEYFWKLSVSDPIFGEYDNGDLNKKEAPDSATNYSWHYHNHFYGCI